MDTPSSRRRASASFSPRYFLRPGRLALGLILAASLEGANSDSASMPALRMTPNLSAAAWTYWSPRTELAQEHGVVSREGSSALQLRAKDFASFGHWSASVTGIEPGRFYHFSALHQTEEVRADGGCVFAMLSWYGGGEQPRELQRDYIDREEAAGEWVRAVRTVQAPAGATSVRIELGLRWTEHGTVYWRDPEFGETPAPAPRVVRLATTRIMPSKPPTIEGNVQRMMEMLERLGPEKPDVVLLSENLATRSVRAPLEEKAQTIPGPLTAALAEKAKKFHTHVIASLLERDGNRFHNTAVLIDRQGQLVGKYRKVHLTISELDTGLTPGTEFPVFDTDIGRIGIVTCWDNWFPEPMRILRLRGAEVVFMGLAGDGDPAHWDAIWPARAIDNGVYLVTSSTLGETPSRILDPTGAIIAEAKDAFAYAVQEIDLNREWRLRYLSVASGAGEARSLYFRERRPDAYAPLTRDSETIAAPKSPGRHDGP